MSDFYDVSSDESCLDNADYVAGGYCRYGPAGLFPLCNLEAPPVPAPNAPMVWGTGQVNSFNVKVCVGHVDTLYFQDDRLWFADGGQW
eukprot:SAG22_NODE_7523_length_731_cov_1.626582_1_plen_88_part_00